MSDASGEGPLFELDPVPLPAIESVHVDKLHGKFTYDIDLAEGVSYAAGVDDTGFFAVNEDRLTLLYGNNGTGKTSLLRLLFHALSPADDRGHRRAVELTRFRSFVVRLTDGIEVRYLRSEGALIGAFRAEIGFGSDSDPHEAEVSVVWEHYPEGDPRRIAAFTTGFTHTQFVSGQLYIDTPDSPDRQFLRRLDELQLNPVFLSDSRAITADVLDSGEKLSASAARQAALRRATRGAGSPDELLQEQRHLDVEDALNRVKTYLSQLAITGTQAGSQRVDTVYLNVAEAIIQHASKVGRPNKGLLPSLRMRIDGLGQRVRPYHQYGLLPEFPAQSLLELLADAPDRNGPVLETVLGPYLDGLEQRMAALEPGLRAISSFANALNSFLEGKTAHFRPGPAEGVSITDDETGERIAPAELSSGEKQIVLLFSDIVALQGQTRLFVIDEPELSLNPQWQRHLMPALLEVTEGSQMQVLAATHSIEIMAKYRRRIRRLHG